MLSAKEQSLLDALSGPAEEHGIEIVTVEITGGRKSPRICVYIDAPGGIDFDTLQSSSAWLGDLMDRIDPFPGAYQLDVSSPGIDRPLRTPAHFAAQIGGTAVVRLKEKLDGRGTFTGIIESTGENGIALRVGEDLVEIPYTAMKRANLRGIVDFNR